MAIHCDYMVCMKCESVVLKDVHGLWHGAHSKEDFDKAKKMGFFNEAPPWDELAPIDCCNQ